jgi:hypothetical protein
VGPVHQDDVDRRVGTALDLAADRGLRREVRDPVGDYPRWPGRSGTGRRRWPPGQPTADRADAFVCGLPTTRSRQTWSGSLGVSLQLSLVVQPKIFRWPTSAVDTPGFYTTPWDVNHSFGERSDA